MSNIETLANQSPLSRSNTTAHDPRPTAGFNNAGHDITATLTRNIFNRSFPDWVKKAGQFSTFLWAPMKVVGQGVKNIQWGTKETETFVDYKVGDLIQIKIKDRPKVYESRIGDLKIRIQCSMDIPPHWHVDKFIDAGEYVTFMNTYKEHLAQSMGKTIYEMFRFFFISSAFGACLPSREYDKLLLRTLALPENTLPAPLPATVEGVGNYTPLTKFMLQHKDHFKALSDEMNKKITNKYVFDCHDIVYTNRGTRFDPYKPWNPKGTDHMNGMKRLANCLVPDSYSGEGVRMPEGSSLPDGRGQRLSREKSLKAFEIVLADIGKRIKRPSHMWWQGNCGNITGQNQDDAWRNSNWPVDSDRYDRNKGTTIMDKPMSERPMLEVVCEKENAVLVMSHADYDDFTGGGYKGYFGSESMSELNFGRVSEQFSEIIPIDDMPCGHAIILDKRMLAAIPHLEASGTDTVAQRLVSVETMHKWWIFGLFDQFVGVRVQMVGFTGAPIDMQNIFFQNKDIQLFTNPR